MIPSQLAVALESAIAARIPLYIWGEPGIGKSQVVRQTADRLYMPKSGDVSERHFIDVRAVLLDPVDLRGLPHVNGDNRAHWAIPDFLPQLGRDADKGVLFLDELNRAPQLVQNACLQLVLDRRIGEYVLPDGWSILAAGNREGTGVHKMDAALRSRFTHVDADVDLVCSTDKQCDWCKWALSPSADIHPMTIAFHRFRTNLLHAYDPKERAFPCPRAWEFVSKITHQNPDPTIAHHLYCGSVGVGAGTEYTAFSRLYMNLIPLDLIESNPDKAEIPDARKLGKDYTSTLFALCSAIARRMSVKNIGKLITYLDRLPQEYAAMSIRDAVQRDKSVTSTKDFVKWSVAHADILF